MEPLRERHRLNVGIRRADAGQAIRRIAVSVVLPIAASWRAAAPWQRVFVALA
jgi:hypothetical protein